MADSSSRRRAPVLPQLLPATAVQPLSGGRRAMSRRLPAQHQRPNGDATRRQHSSEERALMSLCALAVVMVTGLVVFTIVRDTIYRDRSAPLVAPLNP
jgi:hypothetical protein